MRKPEGESMSKQPKPWVESMLVAYVDRQLDAPQMAVVDDIVREDPEARTIVSVLRGSAEALKVAFNRPLHEAVPARDRVRGARRRHARAAS
jgi:anti-sigma factor RsiW